ncbi:MAG: hypothetical protein AABW83_01780 [Nanoarchaeota archaeon]
MEENIKKAFDLVKNDINFLNNEILNIKLTINEINVNINKLILNLNDQDNIIKGIKAVQHINPTVGLSVGYNPTVPLEIEGLKMQNLGISTRNVGVPTDRQTDRQTDTSTPILTKNTHKNIDFDIQEATKILNSLDSIKKDIRLKFKRLTTQEMLVFSTIYQLEDQGYQEITYKSISEILKLSESSIRDYTQRIINKGIPIKKDKINNKRLLLSISSNLRKIATLSTIISLREL